MKKKLIILLITLSISFMLVSCKKEVNYSEIYQNDIYYSLFVRSFADSDGDGIGDLNGVTENLDYLEELGITAIWLLPIFESPSYHGYDTIDYYKIQPEYGTMDDLDNLILKANEKNIKIMLDLVINHTSDQHPWYKEAITGKDSEYYDYYARKNGTIHQSFPGGMMDLNLSNPKVVEEVYNITDFYIEKGVKGFRVDAVHHFFEELGSLHQVTNNIAFMAELRSHLNTYNKNISLVGEVFQYDSGVITSYAKSGSSYFDFFLKKEIQSKIAGGSMTNVFSRSVERHYDRLREYHPNYVNSTFLGNHDLDRVASLPEYQDIDKLKMAVRVLFTLPGSPFVYYGDELGLKGTRYEGDVINDKVVYDEYRRTPFLWGDDRSPSWLLDDGSNKDTKSIDIQKEDQDSIYNTYKEMISIRKEIPALMYGSSFKAYTINKNIVSYIIEVNDDNFKQKVLVVHNTSNNLANLDLSYKILYGSKDLEVNQTAIFELPNNFKIEGV